jgi:Type I phosphodiesterase / nucleotide pyrophosphatase
MIVTVSRWIVRRLISCLLMAALATLVGGHLTNASAQTGPEVRLVLQITIDGLRADLINRYERGFGKGGFRHLMAKGAYYTNAHYQHANTETIVGFIPWMWPQPSPPFWE